MPNIDYVAYANEIVSVDRMFESLLPQSPAFLSLVGFSSVSATNKKHDWYNHSSSPWSSAIASFDVDGDGTGVNVASTSGLVAGSVLYVEKATGASVTELLYVASVDSATELTVTRDYGSTTGVTLVVGDVLKLMSKPTLKGQTYTSSAIEQGTLDYNYTQIFETAFGISGSDLSSNTQDNANTMFFQEKLKLEGLLRQLNRAMIYGRRTAETSSVPSAMGGILEYMEGGGTTAVSGALTATVINNALEDIFDSGASSDNVILMCAPNQARKVSAFNTAGTNPLTTRDESSRSTGSYVTTFVGDLPVMGGQALNVVVEPNFKKDQVAILDLNKISIHPLRDRNFTSRPVNADADGQMRQIIGELTMAFKNPDESHHLLTALSL